MCLEYNICFSAVPDVSASGQLNVLSCVVVTFYLFFFYVHKCFCVSGLGILARARGNFMHKNILRHTFYTVCDKVSRYVRFATSRHV